MRSIFLFIGLILASCGENPENLAVPDNNPDSAQDYSDQAENALNLASMKIPYFLPEPGNCDFYHSKTYYCDGYTQRNVPMAGHGANLTPATESSAVPPSRTTFLQVIGQFQPSRPSIVYLHGWNAESPGKVYPVPDQWVQQAYAAGYNVLAFQWSSLSYDSGYGCPGLGFLGGANIPCNAAHMIYRRGGVSDLFLAAYQQRFAGYQQPVRLVAHSMGSQLAIFSTYRMYKRGDFANVRKPSRIDLIDPFMTPGLGPNRDKPFDGQIASNGNLPADYASNIVSTFKSGSKCRSWSIGFLWWIISPANHLSQYCQNEGMAFSLVKDYQVGMISFASILAGLMAADFNKIMIAQAFDGRAFKGHPLALHVAPVAAYFYSFSPGVPSNGYDASSSDQQILADSRRQAINSINVSRRQTSGFNTITLRDDGFR